MTLFHVKSPKSYLCILAHIAKLFKGKSRRIPLAWQKSCLTTRTKSALIANGAAEGWSGVWKRRTCTSGSPLIYAMKRFFCHQNNLSSGVSAVQGFMPKSSPVFHTRMFGLSNRWITFVSPFTHLEMEFTR
jgi:hypothetical protein